MQHIGRYQILGELGRGAMGIVYKAQDPAIRRTIAIKSIRLQDLTDESERARLRERLFREAQSAGILSHPGIVTIYDIAEQDGMAYIFMEFVNGPPLEKMLRHEQTPDKETLLSIFRQTAAALDYAHKKGIIHRDVKPANIMIHEDGSAKVTDFGVAKIMSQQMTVAGTMLGTPSYMPPEQIEGGVIGGAADQFSLAVIAYEVLTGEKPFTAEYLPTLLFKIVREEPIAPERLNPTLGSRIDAVLRRAMSKKAEDRYPTCVAFIDALAMACAATPGWMPMPRGASHNIPTVGSQEGLQAGMTIDDAEPRLSDAHAPAIVPAAPIAMDETVADTGENAVYAPIPPLAISTPVARMQAKEPDQRDAKPRDQAEAKPRDQGDEKRRDQEDDAITKIPPAAVLLNAAAAAHRVPTSANAVDEIQARSRAGENRAEQHDQQAPRDPAAYDQAHREVSADPLHSAGAFAIPPIARRMQPDETGRAPHATSRTDAGDPGALVTKLPVSPAANPQANLTEARQTNDPRHAGSNHAASIPIQPIPHRGTREEPSHVARNVILSAATVAVVCIIAFIVVSRYTHSSQPVAQQQPAAASQSAADPNPAPADSTPPPPDPSAQAPDTGTPAPTDKPSDPSAGKTDPAVAAKPEPHIERTAAPVERSDRSPASNTSTFHITTNPPGAEATFDNGDRCTSPCTVDLTMGRHTFVARLAGYRDAPRIIDLPSDTGLIIDMSRATGTLSVLSNPSGSAVFVDGQEQSGRTPMHLTLNVGMHKIVVQQGSNKQDFTVEVHDGSLITRTVSFATQ